MSKLAVTLVKSPIGNRPVARATVVAIGLRRLHQTVVVPDNESTRGMVAAVKHLVRVEPAPQNTASVDEKPPLVKVTPAEVRPEAAAAERQHEPATGQAAMVAETAEHVELEVPAPSQGGTQAKMAARARATAPGDGASDSSAPQTPPTRTRRKRPPAATRASTTAQPGGPGSVKSENGSAASEGFGATRSSEGDVSSEPVSAPLKSEPETQSGVTEETE